jgi:hypothetical protein
MVATRSSTFVLSRRFFARARPLAHARLAISATVLTPDGGRSLPDCSERRFDVAAVLSSCSR